LVSVTANTAGTVASSRHSLPRPQLRVVLMCDLADSTALVERLGDHQASELLRRHDALFRELLARHDGQEIDRADGFLALFARPVQAVAFALAYQRAIAGLASTGAAPLRARVGIHLGEVIVWDNAPETIAAGARQFNAEGLAKPVAARLMALAEPGQVLLSEVACALAQRAQGELPETLEGVSWQHHGAYRFKGVSAPMQVYEVGERGRAPLRSPHSDYKARRVLPAWQRYALGALPVLGLVALVLVVGGLLKPTPAIAFRERDWVVLGAVNNQTGDVRFDDSLGTALRIALDQSRYVNVLSELRVRDTLARMTRKEDTPLDRTLGAEVAIREGARALVLPAVAEIGGRLRLSVEVVDPRTQTTVFAETADGVGAESAFASIDKITQSLRKRLGEPLKAIAQADAPAAKVTSANLDAVRAYGLGVQAHGVGRFDDARRHYEQALALDPDFAMARLSIARLDWTNGDLPAFREHTRRAAQLRNRMTAREALILDAWVATAERQKGFAERWKALLDLYPDYHVGAHNYGIFLWEQNRFDEAAEYFGRASIAQSVTRAVSTYDKGIALLGLDRIEEAKASMQMGQSLGYAGGSVMIAAAFAAAGDYDLAHRFLQSESIESPRLKLEHAHLSLAMALDQDDLDAAGKVAIVIRDMEPSITGTYHWLARVSPLAWQTRAQPGKLTANAAASAVHDIGAALPAALGTEDAEVLSHALLYAGWIAADNGDVDAAREAIAATATVVDVSPIPRLKELAQSLAAQIDIITGRPEKAIARLQSLQDGTAPYLARITLLKAFRSSGRREDADKLQNLLAGRRGYAYAEESSGFFVLPENVSRVPKRLP
jgi:putative peptide modification system cyclase